MRQPALLQVTSLLLLLLGCKGLPCAHDHSPRHSKHLSECVKRKWFCPQCRQCNVQGNSCNHCLGQRKYTDSLLKQKTAAWIAQLESILEQVKKGDGANFLTEQASPVDCLTHLLDRLREDGITLPSSQKGPRWVCFRCQHFNVAGEHTCKKCDSEYSYDPSHRKKEITAFIQYVTNVVSRFKEYQTTRGKFRQHEPSGATPDLDLVLEALNVSEAKRNTFLQQQRDQLAAYNQNKQLSSNLAPHRDQLAAHNQNKQPSSHEECPICFEDITFNTHGASQCPVC